MPDFSDKLNQFKIYIISRDFFAFQEWYQNLNNEEKIEILNKNANLLFILSVEYNFFEMVQFILTQAFINKNQLLQYKSSLAFDIAFKQNFQLIHQLLFQHANRHIKNKIVIQFFELLKRNLQFNHHVVFENLILFNPEVTRQVVFKQKSYLIIKILEKKLLNIFLYIAQYHFDILLKLLTSNNNQILNLICEKGFRGLIEYIWNSYPTHQNNFLKANHYQLFNLAVLNHHRSIIHFFLIKHPELTCKMISANHFNAFTNACRNGHIDIVIDLYENYKNHPMAQKVFFYEQHHAIKESLAHDKLIIAFWLLKQMPAEYYLSTYGHVLDDLLLDLFELSAIYHQQEICEESLKIIDSHFIDPESTILKILPSIFKNDFIQILNLLLPHVIPQKLFNLISQNNYLILKELCILEHFQIIDICLNHIQNIEDYANIIDILKQVVSLQHFKWVEAHEFFYNIKILARSLTEPFSHERPPLISQFLDIFPIHYQLEALKYFNIQLQTLNYVPHDLFNYLDSMIPLVTKILELTFQEVIPLNSASQQNILNQFDAIEFHGNVKHINRPSNEFIHYFKFINSIFQFYKKNYPFYLPKESHQSWQEYEYLLDLIEAHQTQNITKIFELLPTRISIPIIKNLANNVYYDILVKINSKIEHPQLIPMLAYHCKNNRDIKNFFFHDLVKENNESDFIDFEELQNIQNKVLSEVRFNYWERVFLKTLQKHSNDYHPIVLKYILMSPQIQSSIHTLYPQTQLFVIEKFLCGEYFVLNTQNTQQIGPEIIQKFIQEFEATTFDFHSFKVTLLNNIFNHYMYSLQNPVTARTKPATEELELNERLHPNQST